MSENSYEEVTTFHLEVDLRRLAGDPHEELSRILRYWAGSLKHYEVDKPHAEALMDSTYSDVGSWRLT